MLSKFLGVVSRIIVCHYILKYFYSLFFHSACQTDEREIGPNHKFYSHLSDEDVEQDEEEVWPS